MNAQEGTAKFQEADTLFQQGRFQDALVLLDELDAAFPGTKNIMYPRALCLEKAGRLDESESLCDQLIGQFQNPGAQALKARIQGARAAADPLAAMNMNALDDFFDKPAKRTPAPAAASGFPDMLRYALIGVVVVAILGIAGFGYTKGWFASGGETIEQVQARLIDAWSKAEGYSAFLDLKGQVQQQGMTLDLTGGGSVDYMKKDGKDMFRLEGSVSIGGGPMAMDMPILAVGDGTNAYMQFSMMGKQVVTKSPMPPSSQVSPDVAKMFFEDLRKEFEIGLLRDEMVDGKPAYAFELKPKAGSKTADGLKKAGGNMDKLKAHFTKDFTQVRFQALEQSGKPLVTLSIKDINFKPSLLPEKFLFKVPDGVQVMDMTDPSSLMKMMQ